MPVSIAPPDPRLYVILAEAGFSDDIFNARQHRGCELVEQYVLHLALELVERLGLDGPLAEGRGVDDLLRERGFAAGFRLPLRWLLERLVAAGLLVREGVAYRLPRPLPPAALAELGQEGLACDPSYAPTYALLDEAAAVYSRVARGETSGERALFQRVALWCAYFNNANGYYALTNRVAARVAAARVAGQGAAVLEVGGGLGSATEALIDALVERGTLRSISAYTFTEPVAFFRRRAERGLAALRSGLPFTFFSLDINEPWPSQGIRPGTLALVWGVNVFHLARNLAGALHEALTSLAPGGWLVLGEGLRPFPTAPVGAEFPFQILESFVDVALDPETRPMPGFLTAEQWQHALADAGFEAIEIVPDVVRLRAVHPGFFAAAVCGRRPHS